MADGGATCNERKMSGHDLGRVLVLGRGVTGSAVIAYLEPLVGTRVRSLDVWEGEPGEGSFDLCIASPGISEFSDLYQVAKASSAELISEVEFAWRESAPDSRWIAITGTNGKTTTTSLIAHILRNCGLEVRLVGNIGDACIEAVAADGQALGAKGGCYGIVPFVTYVVEMSSYQLASTALFCPDVAVVLNIRPDHLTWHRTHENYAAAKWKIMGNMGSDPHQCVVLNATDDEVRSTIRRLRKEGSPVGYIPLGTADGLDSDMRERCGSENAAFVDAEGMLTVAFRGRTHSLARTEDLRILGRHNVENALAAASACIAFAEQLPGKDRDGSSAIDLSDGAIADALGSFKPIAHRIETVAMRSGITFVNDSKATNVDATLAALTAFPEGNAIILLGGRDKGTDLTELVREAACATKGRVLFGESYERFAQAFDDQGVPYLSAPDMEGALEAAYGLAEAGDVVLLSPACASFDEFSCFEERGEIFSRLAQALPEKGI